MLFKILHGDASRISTDITPFHEGYCYVTKQGYIYVDMNLGTKDVPNNQRVKLNAAQAEAITGYNISTILSSSDIEIPTSKAVLTAIEECKTVTNGRIDTIEGKISTIENGAQVNVLESIKLNGVVQEINNKAVNIPLATNTILGLVMGSSAENKISIATDGTMEVNGLNVNKLVQTAGDSLVLDGGNSNT